MKKTNFAVSLNAALGLIASMLFAGCASAPETQPEQGALEAQADATVETMVARDPTLAEVLAGASGFVVFPEIAQGGVMVGGAQGVGVVYERNRPIGYAELRGASIGAQLGGQSFSQIMVLQTPEALERLRSGNFDLSAGLTATAVQSGAAARAQFEDGVAVFIADESGLMAGATVGGESITFRAK